MKDPFIALIMFLSRCLPNLLCVLFLIAVGGPGSAHAIFAINQGQFMGLGFSRGRGSPVTQVNIYTAEEVDSANAAGSATLNARITNEVAGLVALIAAGNAAGDANSKTATTTALNSATQQMLKRIGELPKEVITEALVKEVKDRALSELKEAIKK